MKNKNFNIHGSDPESQIVAVARNLPDEILQTTAFTEQHLPWTTIDATQMTGLLKDSYAVITISSFFQPAGKSPVQPANFRLSDNSVSLLNKSIQALRLGGLLFVYGLPRDLPYIGEYLSNHSEEKTEMLFKYWITLGIDETPSYSGLQPTSMGLLMYLKSKKSKATPSPFHLNTDAVRFQHQYCLACKENVKDWGGKKHLMHPEGTALSDVWRDLTLLKIEDHVIPELVIKRIHALTEQPNAAHLHIVQQASALEVSPEEVTSVSLEQSDVWDSLILELDHVYQGNCISFLNKVSELHPEGIFDLAFADPPYNLQKSYGTYHDGIIDQQYIEWCNQWLEGMVRTLKPGGSMFILNLPKWSVHHSAYLNRRLEFRNWITWDALSDPRGKIMPAHYSLLYYTKPGGDPTFNYEKEGGVQPPDSLRYCLRASCIKKRKKVNDDIKVKLGDIWSDIHRIKHKRDRDAHPCQLPEKLMERIILLASRPGSLIFDPFCGAGTTAISAKKLGRHFITTEIDLNYVRITREKLASMDKHADMFGELKVPRSSVQKQKGPAAKKHIETYLQTLAQRLGREPHENEIDAEILQQIDAIYPSRLSAIKRCRVVLRAQLVLQTSA
jgi:site-specific DNA-methyltransferase (adenine-specific)